MRSLELVPLRISSIRNRTGSPDRLRAMDALSRATSARNFDFPSSRESVTASDAHTVRRESRALEARTGPPANAITAFNPTVLSIVLLPAMFEPVIR